MRKMVVCVLFFLATAFSVQTALAATLWDWAFHIDGSLEYTVGPMPVTGTLDPEGLGTLSWTTLTQVDHVFIAFLDFDFSENSYDIEYGSQTGSPLAGQSWEIDEPGWVFGDIFDHVVDGVLDNTNAVPQGLEDDVSIALGWNFTLDPGYLAMVELTIGKEIPLTQLYLSQTDPDSNETIYFSSTLTMSPVPEPGTVLLLGMGLLCFFGRKRRE